MVLAPNDFITARVNWQDKAANVLSIVEELNLSLDSVVFVDDNPVERARVREACEGVLVPELPVDVAEWPHVLEKLDVWATRATPEDYSRTQLYHDEKKRQQLRKEAGSYAEWLQGLETVVTIAPLCVDTADRAVQLLVRCNQMNLNKRIVGKEYLLAYRGTTTYTVSVHDRCGDAGVVGLLTLCKDEWCVTVDDFVLSCRVMGRGIEGAMLHYATGVAVKQGVPLLAKSTPTGHNGPCLTFWKTACPDTHGTTYRWTAPTAYPLPAGLTLVQPPTPA
jgi:FkbH-like protein